MTERQVGWAFVGASGWVESRFAPSVLAAGHRVVGAFGSSAASSARFAEKFGGTAFGSLEEMLADDAVDAVWVASPTAQHPAHALAAANAGHAVLVEKPLALDVEAARALAADLSATGVLAGVGFQHRFNPAVTAMAEALADGRIGTLSSLVIHHGVAGPAQPTAWRTDPAQSGGWSIADLGTHLLDAAQALLGRLDFWAARLSSPGRSLAVDDLSCVMLASGEATVVVRASTGTPGPASYLEASGTQGWVRVTDFWTGGGRLTDSSGRDVEIPAADPYVAQVRAFSAAVNGAAWTGATVDDGVAVVEWHAAAREFSERRAAAAVPA
ncbi:Gfo/Idh/MocA family protein [Planosporangium sp. 12N6]|uniref:Gfo/Idh/MocA family protein n=1 Tax=Planosporangium spinosum TaxID=3402278 RepID=UPI003CEDB693